jgi:hypothetical protein
VTSSTIVIILIVIAVLVLGLIAFLIIRRQRYIRALRGRGWTFESRPSLESVLDHHAPPFGLGFVRKVDEAISGQTATGVPFRVFEYASSDGGPKFDDRIASMQLPLPLPDLFVSTDQARSGVPVAEVEVDPRFQVRTADAGYAKRPCPRRYSMRSLPLARRATKLTSASTANSWLRLARQRILSNCRATWSNLARSPRHSIREPWRRTR